MVGDGDAGDGTFTYLGDENLAKYCTMIEVLYVLNWYANLDRLWGSDILKVFP